jgi:hypothetical protein
MNSLQSSPFKVNEYDVMICKENCSDMKVLYVRKWSRAL